MTRRKRVTGPESVPDDLTREQKLAIWKWCEENAPNYANRDTLKTITDECLDYHRGIGNPTGYVEWPAVIRNRIRHLAENDPARHMNLRPVRRATREPKAAGPLFQLFAGGKKP